MPKHDHLEALGGMNIMLNKTARAGVSEEYHQAFFDPFYPVIGAVGALVLASMGGGLAMVPASPLMLSGATAAGTGPSW